MRCLVGRARYHPSRQNTNTGVLTREMWLGVFREAPRRTGGAARAPSEETRL